MSELFWITDYLAVGPRTQIGSLKLSGIECIIDLNSDPKEAEEAKRSDVEYHPCLLTDETSDEDWLMGLDKISRTVQNAKNHGKKTYLHCTQGQGRSPTAAMACLIDQSMSLVDAVANVRQKNPKTWSSGNPVGKYNQILERYYKLKKRQNPATFVKA
jgi:protein-tyrosine phosphatase